MRVPEDVGPRFDLPRSTVTFPLPSPNIEFGDLGTTIPSLGDLIGTAFVLGFVVLIFYMAYRILVIPEGKWLKIQRRHKDWA
jgi:hypothetical protein